MSLKMNTCNVMPMSVDVGNGWGQHVLLDLEIGDGIGPLKIDKVSPVCYMDNVDYEYLEEGWMSEGIMGNNVVNNNKNIKNMVDDSVVLSALSKVVYVGMSIANWVTGG
jgi:hypothetical protein